MFALFAATGENMVFRYAITIATCTVCVYIIIIIIIVNDMH